MFLLLRATSCIRLRLRTVVDDVDLVANYDACVGVLVVIRGTEHRIIGLKRLVLDVFVALATLLPWLRCDGRRSHVVLVLQGERPVGERIQLARSNVLDRVVTRAALFQRR